MLKQPNFKEFTFGQNFRGDFRPPPSTFWTPKRSYASLKFFQKPARFELQTAVEDDSGRQSLPEKSGNIPSKSTEYSNGVR
ncbi:hypothetical protein D8674_008093 [Pyrus ussuriensis x Pyrus communis]|uniref:Uncharacterized protein n=1 Tax=Pyrus ussuriensis x Pyrus communis TaxID=2448454 RepID=A0A5N5I4P6_9ROSA|nr:hypothetical protein D8674_008093 [Pyrus ussuriensis x Pyrus communis]